MTVDMNKAISHMEYFRSIGVTYSMYGSRTGADGTADCSGAVYASLNYAGGTNSYNIPNTDSLHNYLTENGFNLVTQGYYISGAQRGDIFIWGQRGSSGYANGHTGIFVDSHNVIHMNYSNNGVSTDSYTGIHQGQYTYLYRLANSQPKPEPAIDRSLISIYYVAGYGVKAVDSNGNQIPQSEQTLKHGTKWHASGVYMINGKPAYAIGRDRSGWYVYQAYTNQCNQVTINYYPGYGVNGVDRNGNTVQGSNSTFRTDSSWSTYLSEAKVINGSVHYLVGNNLYVPSFYTYGGGFSG